MDQSVAELAARAAYGGSDATVPSFNFPAYVRFASVHEPRDFGVVETLKLDLQGLVGAESGTQTLFFSFTLAQPAKIGLRRIRLNPYTDQYISTSLRDGGGNQIPLGVDGFARSGIDDAFAFEILEPIEVDIGYVNCGYWDNGYAEYDCFRVPLPARNLSGDPEDPFEPIDAELLPAGEYVFTVSSSQWPKLPYRIQLVAAPQPALSGTAGGRLDGSARLTLNLLAGAAGGRLDLQGAIQRELNLSGGADLVLAPTATLDRQSPFS
jgi:hypothetical protein